MCYSNVLLIWKVNFDKNAVLPVEKFTSLTCIMPQECDNVTIP